MGEHTEERVSGVDQIALGAPLIEAKHLRLLSVLQDTGSHTKAAELLNYTQSAVSQQVSGLERKLGVKLVERGQHGVTLTPSGVLLVRFADPVLRTLRLAHSELMAMRDRESRTVRIATFASATATLLAATIAYLAKESEELEIVFLEYGADEALDALATGAVDIALVFDFETKPLSESALAHLRAVELVRERMWLVTAEEPVEKGVEALRALSGARWIAACEDCGDYLEALGRSVGFSPEVIFRTNDFVGLQSLVERGYGVGILPDLVLAAYHAPKLVATQLHGIPVRRVLAVTSEGLLQRPAVHETLLALRRVAAGDVEPKCIPETI